MAPYVMALREAWHRSRLSAGQIAARAGVGENTVYLVMGGRRKVRIDSVIAVASALGVAVLPVHRDGTPTSNRISA